MGDRETVERFFSEKLPLAIAAQKELFARTRGALAVMVEGAGGWTITFGKAANAIVDEGDPDADCFAVWTLESFVALLSGCQDLDVIRPAAVLGDEKLIARLGSLLLPAARGGMGARLASLAA